MGRAFFVLIVLAAGAVVWMSLARTSPAPPAPPPPPPLAPPSPPVAGTPAAPPKTPPAKREKQPLVLEDPIAPTREARLAFLELMAGPTPAPKGGGMFYPSADMRGDALEALTLIPGHDPTRLLLAALGGDGEPGNWGADRLRAAAIRAAAGQADGRETVKAFLRDEPDLASSDAVAPAADAIARMGAEEGGNAIRRLLAVQADEWGDEDQLAAVLQAAAALGAGATKDELLRYAHPKEDAFDARVRGAAAGAMLRLGDARGMTALEAVREDGFGEQEFAVGLGAPGNEAAVEPLVALLSNVDTDYAAKEAAAFSLARIGGEKAKAALVAAMAKGDPDSAPAVATSLALLGDASQIALVRTAAGSKDSDLSVPAWKALALLKDAGSKEAAERLLAE
ncbi:MAG TPA: hypothetical protein VFS92_07730, partial [Planctomycetota bacterium]|nr:hypothetical protein [Planctomycetota bacterium]